MTKRCTWAGPDEVYIRYHDEEWGVPTHNDRELFEMLVLESFQAGLSWITILKKRENFKKAFDDFDVEKVAGYDEKKVEELRLNEGIIRHKGKINAAINNAQIFIELRIGLGGHAALDERHRQLLADGWRRIWRQEFQGIDQADAYGKSAECAQELAPGGTFSFQTHPSDEVSDRDESDERNVERRRHKTEKERVVATVGNDEEIER